jgi:hypothetical protein
MTFGGLAMVLIAIGPALILNRALNAGAATQIQRFTLAVLCLSAAAVVLTVWIVTRRARTPTTQQATEPGGWTALVTAALALATVGIPLLISSVRESQPSLSFGHGSLGVALLCGALGFVVIAVYYNGKARRDEQDLSDLQFEHDLLRYKVEPFESRAEKLLSVNQVQLRRYYDLNLQQARAVFVVGIGCIAAGLVVIGVTFWIVWTISTTTTTNVAEKEHTQTIVALVGAVGTVLTNFVAALYFRMHHLIGKSLVEFHGKLAGTHDLFFANVLASSIKDKTERSQTLVKLAVAIAERQVGRHNDVGKGADTTVKSQ